MTVLRVKVSKSFKPVPAAMALFVFALPVFSAMAFGATEEVTIVRSGKPVASIVLGKSATATERKAAGELARYVKRMSGAELAIVDDVPDGNAPLVLIGRETTNPSIAALIEGNQIKLSREFPGLDGFIVRTVKLGSHPVLVMGGSRDRGTLYAVYHFLKKICHIGFFWAGEYVPATKDLAVADIDMVAKPRWPVRQYNQGCAFEYSWMYYWTWQQQARELEWAAWHRQNRIMWPTSLPAHLMKKGLEKHQSQSLRMAVEYARQLGIGIIGLDHVYGVDPYPEQRVSDDPQKEDKLIADFARKAMARVKAMDPQGILYTSGWAFFNPGWRTETAKAFFGAIGSDDFYIADIWGEVHPIYKKYDYFYGKKWLFGILHSFGGTASLHGNLKGLVRSVKSVAADPKANRCLGLYINPEIIHYNDLYFELASELSWNPDNVKLDDFLRDYSLRRYGARSAPAMYHALKKLAATVYGTDDMTPPYYQLRMADSFPATFFERSKYIPSLIEALEIALGQSEQQQDNRLYTRDLIDVGKQCLGEFFNYQAIKLYNAYSMGDGKSFEAAATLMRESLGQLKSLLRTAEYYQISDIIKSIKTIPGISPENIGQAERYLKDTVFTFAASQPALIDYNRRDMLELVQAYYGPRVEAYIDFLRGNMRKKLTTIDKDKLFGIYAGIEKAWIDKPLPPVNVDNSWAGSVAAARACTLWLKKQSAGLDLSAKARLKNGGFETGSVEGWKVAFNNVKLKVQRYPDPREGFFLDYTTDPAVKVGDHQFSMSQEILLTPGMSFRVGLRYFIKKFSGTANARVITTGFDKKGNRKFVVVYYWGGGSWDWGKATPDKTGGFYAMKFKKKSTLGKWHKLEVLPLQDIDDTFGEGTSARLGIDHVKVEIACWTGPNGEQFISGYFDEITFARGKVIPPKVEKLTSLDDMESRTGWKGPNISYATDIARQGKRALSLAFTVDKTKPLQYTIVKDFSGRVDLTPYNKIGFWVYPKLAGTSTPTITVRYNADKVTKWSTEHWVSLVPGKWNYCQWDISGERRGALGSFYITVHTGWNQYVQGDKVKLYFDDFNLVKSTAPVFSEQTDFKLEGVFPGGK